MQCKLRPNDHDKGERSQINRKHYPRPWPFGTIRTLLYIAYKKYKNNNNITLKQINIRSK